MKRCNCERGGNCTWTTVCAIDSAVEDAESYWRERVEDLEAENERLKAVLDAEARNRTRILDEVEAEVERQRQGIISLRCQYDEQAAENERLRGALKWISDNFKVEADRALAAVQENTNE